MADLSAQCPKCGKKVTRYVHAGSVEPGIYSMDCEPYYSKQNENGYCGHEFKVAVQTITKVTVVDENQK